MSGSIWASCSANGQGISSLLLRPYQEGLLHLQAAISQDIDSKEFGRTNLVDRRVASIFRTALHSIIHLVLGAFHLLPILNMVIYLGCHLIAFLMKTRGEDKALLAFQDIIQDAAGNEHINTATMRDCDDLWTKAAIQAATGTVSAQKGQKQTILLSRRTHNPGVAKTSLPLSNKERQIENKKTIHAYLDFLQKEYGTAKIEQVVRTYQPHTSLILDLKKLRDSGNSLTAEHIYMYNIGLHDFDMSDIHTFLDCANKKQFLGRHQRGLNRIVGDKNKQDKFLKACQGKKIELLDLATFQTIVKILAPPTDGDSLYTGRKITDPIQGSYTRTKFVFTFSPWQDQQELLQVFEELKGAKTNESFYELLAKVVVKKSLMRSNGDTTWRVGELIPGPKGVWYFVHQAVDAHGKVFYTLLPAHRDYDRSAPEILLYRSTASDPYAQGGAASVLSDLNPHKLPGVDARKLGKKEEEEFFKKFTAPMWLVYYEKSINTNFMNWKKKQQFLIKAAKLLGIEVNPQDSTQKLEQIIREKANASDEWDSTKKTFKNKSLRPVAILGDSLGGALAQNAITTHISHPKRAPLTSMMCFSHSAPVIKQEGKYGCKEFKKFKEGYENDFPGILKILHVWVQYDLIPTALRYWHRNKDGSQTKRQGAHLGYNTKSTAKCEAIGYFFSSRPEATAPEITSFISHEKRFLKTGLVEGRDYNKTKYDVRKFDDAHGESWLTKLRSRRLYKVLKKSIELGRQVMGRRNLPKKQALSTFTVTYSPDSNQNKTQFQSRAGLGYSQV